MIDSAEDGHLPSDVLHRRTPPTGGTALLLDPFGGITPSSTFLLTMDHHSKLTTGMMIIQSD